MMGPAPRTTGAVSDGLTLKLGAVLKSVAQIPNGTTGSAVRLAHVLPIPFSLIDIRFGDLSMPVSNEGHKRHLFSEAQTNVVVLDHGVTVVRLLPLHHPCCTGCLSVLVMVPVPTRVVVERIDTHGTITPIANDQAAQQSSKRQVMVNSTISSHPSHQEAAEGCSSTGSGSGRQ